MRPLASPDASIFAAVGEGAETGTEAAAVATVAFGRGRLAVERTLSGGGGFRDVSLPAAGVSGVDAVLTGGAPLPTDSGPQAHRPRARVARRSGYEKRVIGAIYTCKEQAPAAR